MHIRRHAPEKGIPSVFVMTVAWFALVTIFGVAIHFCRDNEDSAHARDVVPPPIIDVRGLRPTTKPAVVAATEPSTHAPADGPMCAEPLVLTDDMPERERVEHVITTCGTLRGPVGKGADPFMVLELIRLESDIGAPANLLVATYCVEAAMQARGRYAGRFLGDWKDGKARALGPFQLHENVWSGTCRGTPDAPHDMIWAGRCYWKEVLRVEAKARRVTKCGDADMLGVGEANAANFRRYGWRCKARSEHWKMMEAMR